MEMKNKFSLFLTLVLCIAIAACAPAPAPSADWVQLPATHVTVLDLSGSNGAELAAFVTLPEMTKGLQAVLNEDPCTFVFWSRLTGNFLLGWPTGSSYAVIELDPTGIFARHLGDVYRGQRISSETVTNMLNKEIANGGEMTTLQMIGSQALTALQGFLQWANAATLDFIPVILFMPGGVLPGGNFPGLSPSVQG